MSLSPKQDRWPGFPAARKRGMRRALSEEGSEEDRERFQNVEELASVAARHGAKVALVHDRPMLGGRVPELSLLNHSQALKKARNKRPQ